MKSFFPTKIHTQFSVVELYETSLSFKSVRLE